MNTDNKLRCQKFYKQFARNIHWSRSYDEPNLWKRTVIYSMCYYCIFWKKYNYVLANYSQTYHGKMLIICIASRTFKIIYQHQIPCSARWEQVLNNAYGMQSYGTNDIYIYHIAYDIRLSHLSSNIGEYRTF